MRIGILGFLQESNTFVAEKTTLADFSNDVLVSGEEVRSRFQNSSHEIAGFFAGLEEADMEAVPLFVARALPFGIIESASFDELMSRMLKQLEQNAPLDGMLVAPHGATVTDEHPDADGWWLSKVRNRLGANVPIVGTLDPHANLSPQMVRACDALIAYRTNPHIDQFDRGLEAAGLIAKVLRREHDPRMAAAFPPLALSIDQQATDDEPCRSLVQNAQSTCNTPGVLSASVVLGFPYADVAEIGSSAIVVADGDFELAELHARRLASLMWESRVQNKQRLNVEQAIDLALQSEEPVCLLDMGDNVGGGSSADGTWISRALYNRRVPRSLACLCDMAAVEVAQSVGVGNSVHLAVGGKHPPYSGEPLRAEFKVVGLYNGRFADTGITHGGFKLFDQGPSAVLRSDSGLTLLVTSRRMVPFSLAQLESCDINPSKYRIIVAKGVNAPITSYQRVCRSFIRVDTPGITTADMTRLNYEDRRRPLFPFERDFEWQPVTVLGNCSQLCS